MTQRASVLVAVLLVISPLAQAAEPAKSVAELQESHDRALVRDLAAYIAANPKAEDLDQAYMALFDKVIEHDWFADQESVAARYLKAFPDGPVASLARIVTTMARAQAGRFDEALARYKELMGGLGKTEQEEFAANFADSLASATTAAGQYDVSRQVYEILIGRYADSPALRQKVRDELTRLDLVGKPAPSTSVSDVKGNALRLSDLRGKYVLVDFWATWCAPCVGELPRLQAAHAKYRDAGFEIIGVSLDESKTALADFVKVRNIPWRQVHNASSGGDLVEAFGVKSIPATFLIDPNGTIVRLELRGRALDEALEKLLANRVARRTSR